MQDSEDIFTALSEKFEETCLKKVLRLRRVTVSIPSNLVEGSARFSSLNIYAFLKLRLLRKISRRSNAIGLLRLQVGV